MWHFYSPIHFKYRQTTETLTLIHKRVQCSCIRNHTVLQLNPRQIVDPDKVWFCVCMYVCLCLRENIIPPVAAATAIIVERTLHTVHSIGWLVVCLHWIGPIVFRIIINSDQLIVTVNNNICIIDRFYWFFSKETFLCDFRSFFLYIVVCVVGCYVRAHPVQVGTFLKK